MLPWGAQIVPDASPVQQITVPGGRTYGVRMLFLSEKLGGQPIPDTSPVQQITVPGGRTYDVRMLFLLTCRGAQIIPDTSPVQQITVPGDRNYGVRMLFLSDVLCSLGVPKSSLTRHLCIKSPWVVFDKMAQSKPFWAPNPFLTRAGCSKSRFRKVG